MKRVEMGYVIWSSTRTAIALPNRGSNAFHVAEVRMPACVAGDHSDAKTHFVLWLQGAPDQSNAFVARNGRGVSRRIARFH